MLITSINNQTIKELDKLKQKKYRDLEQKFLIEGEHLVEEAEKSGVLEKIILLENSEYHSNLEKIYVSKNVMKKISSLDTPPNIIGVSKMLSRKDLGKKVLLLDDIQDPGNLGTIIRSSVAFNVDSIVMSLNTVDLYNPKVIRSTQGMIFKINLIKDDLGQVIEKLKSKNIPIYTTNVNGGENIKNINSTDSYGLIMGNEGNGVKDEISTLADRKIYIPMNSKVESLNVSVAASILLYELGDKNG